MKNVFVIIISFLLLICISINCFADYRTYIFNEVDRPSNISSYDFVPLDDVMISIDEPFYFWPGTNYYISISIESSIIEQELDNDVVIYDSNGKVFIVITPEQVLFNDGHQYLLDYFDPSDGGNIRYFQITPLERSYLYYGIDTSGVNINLYYINGQQGMIDAGSGVMHIVTAYVDEVILHWPLVLFCIVLPVISVAVTIVISIRERRDKN